MYQAYAKGLWSLPKPTKYATALQARLLELYCQANKIQRNLIAVPSTKGSGSGSGMTDPRMIVSTVINNDESAGQWTCTYCGMDFRTKIGLGVHKSHVHREELNLERLSQQRRVRGNTNGERVRNAVSSRRPWTESETAALAELHVELRMAQPDASEAAINRDLASKLSERSVDAIKGQKKTAVFRNALARLTATSSRQVTGSSHDSVSNGLVSGSGDMVESSSVSSGTTDLVSGADNTLAVESGTMDQQIDRTVPDNTTAEATLDEIASPMNVEIAASAGNGAIDAMSRVDSRYNQVDHDLLAKLKEDTRLYARHTKAKPCFGLKHLLYVLLNVRRGDPSVVRLLEGWLDLVIKAVMGDEDTIDDRSEKSGFERRNRREIHDGYGSGKTLKGKAKQREYEYLKSLHKRRGIRAVAQHVLKNCEDVENSNDSNVEKPKEPSGEEMYGFWKQVFDDSNDLNNSNASRLNRACENSVSDDTAWANCVWVAVCVDDIKRSEIANGKASGPDGVSPKFWKRVPRSIRAIFYNVVMYHGVVLPRVAKARTVFIPKVRYPSKPEEYRPISIASVVGRQLHRIFANRLTAVLRNSDEQVAFRRGIDGTSRNLVTYRTLIDHAKKAGRDVHVVSMDLKRAFPSVHHSAIIETMSELKSPSPFLDYLAQLYSTGNTYLELPNGQHSSSIRITRGVFQGDPLSPCIFNFVMDRALRKLNVAYGYDLGGGLGTISCMAFADDVNIVGSSVVGTQMNVNRWLKELGGCGLEANWNKCLALSLRWDGHRKVHILETKNYFKINREHEIQSIGPSTKWKYLGVHLTGEKIDKHLPSLQGKLNRVKDALLKPQQKLEIIGKIIIPSINHQACLGLATQDELNSIDTHVRSVVRGLMHLPQDVPNCYIHAPIRCGGMGIPELAVRIPINRFSRMKRFTESNARVATLFERSLAFQQAKGYAVRLLRNSGVDIDKDIDPIGKLYLGMLKDHYATKHLSEAYNSRASRSWCGRMSNEISGGDFIKYHLLSSYSIPTLARRNWGQNRGSEHTNCRDGCGRTETMHHVLQECKRTHGGRVLRHDRALDYVFRVLQTKWDGTAEIVKEPHIQTPSGLAKPDLIFYAETEKVAYVIDLHVVGGEYMKEARERKVAKYRNMMGMSDAIKQRYNVERVYYESITVSNMGIIDSASLELLKKLDFSGKSIFRLVTSILRGSWLNWFCFKRTHQLVFHQRLTP